MSAFNRCLTAVVVGILVFAGCSAVSKLKSAHGTKFRYSYALTAPINSTRLAFQDNDVSLLFRFDDAAIRFKLTNRSFSPVRIKWQEVTVVVQGRSYAALNARTLYRTNPGNQENPTVLPGGYIVDMALPSANILFNGKQWVERDLLPTTGRHSETIGKKILANVGSTVTLLLPIELGDQVRRYSFEFKVTKVDTLAWERYRRPNRPAPPTQVASVKMGEADKITTAIVVGGLLGFAAFLLTQKKAPPSE